jgi:hypothetical protein
MQFERITNIYLSTILQVPLVAPVRQERRAVFLGGNGQIFTSLYSSRTSNSAGAPQTTVFAVRCRD